MITPEELCRRVPGLTIEELSLWVERDWVRPLPGAAPHPGFAEIDCARVRLILELRTELEVEDRTLPLVLSLLDQLYAARADLRRALAALDDAASRRLLDGLRDAHRLA